MRSFADRESDSSLAHAITWVGVALQAVWTVAILWMGRNARSSDDGLIVLLLGAFVLFLVWGWRWVIYLREHIDRRSGKWRLAPLLVIACVFVGSWYWVSYGRLNDF